MVVTKQQIKELAAACGFELAGIAPALPSEDLDRFEQWRAAGMAGEMSYMTDRRGDLRADPRNLLPQVQSIICVGKVYNAEPLNGSAGSDRGLISRYACSEDYHDILRRDLERLVAAIRDRHAERFEYRICVDTAPLLERSYARAAGLGWIGKNTCLINQGLGSWLFLGELLLSIPLAPDEPVPFRCGSCTRCIDSCPTQALVPSGAGEWALDARLCISYLTIEKRGEIPAGMTHAMGNHIFGCDICQEVCPWNRRPPFAGIEAREFPGNLPALAELSEEEFRKLFRRSPVWRARYQGFLRNVAIALGNSRNLKMREPLTKLARHGDAVIARTARSALAHLDEQCEECIESGNASH